MIMAQARRAVAQLTEIEQEQVRFLAVTLDPESDDQAALASMALGQRVSTPMFHLLSGEPAAVNRALDDMGIHRVWNEELRRIDHTNQFIVLDRNGFLAYRFSLGELQERWLVEALKLLIAEPEAAP
jgi:protein SCO1